MLKRLIFPAVNANSCVSASLLVLRLVFGGMLITHGWGKLMNFSEIAPNFMGGEIGLGLSVMAEVFCAAAIVVGFLHRLAIIPLVVIMAVAFFVVHKAVLVGEGSGEMALLYLAAFVALLIAGPGKYSIDSLFAPNKRR